MIRFCRKCKEAAESSGLLDTLVLLAKRGAWHCPHEKPQCGKVLE